MAAFDLIAAAHTAFDNQGRVNLSVIEKQAQHILQNGMDTAFVIGSTGEFCSLSIQERKEIAQTWVKIARDKLKIMVHVGHNSLVDACELARHAAKLQVTAIAANAPHYYRPGSLADLINFYQKLVASAADTPFYFYHIPTITGVDFPMVEFMKQASERIPNFAGIKYTGMNIVEYHQCLNFDRERFQIFYGNDEQLLLPLSMGATGAVGSTFNYAAPLYWKLIKAFSQDNHKDIEEASAQIFALIGILFEFGVLPGGKAIMGLLGVDCGTPRPPCTRSDL